MSVSKKISFTKTLQFSISAIILLVTLIILSGFAGFQYFKAKNQMLSQLNILSENTALRMSKYLANPMWAVEKNLIDSFIEAEMLNPDIFGILVYESNGKAVITGKGRDKNWQLYETQNIFHKSDTPENQIFSTKKDIFMPEIKKESLGIVEVFVTKQFITQKLNKFLAANLIAMAALILILTAAIFMSLRKLMLAPLEMLIDATEKMSMGDLNTPIEIKSNNEIGILASSIERMRQSMILAFKKLNSKSKSI
ncbi:MAG: HAMP domain-containing protein [Desulfobacteraceae bacterium]|nr:HAMP domain-containing protein [Desulfobacteraceae bacterium]